MGGGNIFLQKVPVGLSVAEDTLVQNLARQKQIL